VIGRSVCLLHPASCFELDNDLQGRRREMLLKQALMRRRLLVRSQLTPLQIDPTDYTPMSLALDDADIQILKTYVRSPYSFLASYT
jgi:hypothetical protein